MGTLVRAPKLKSPVYPKKKKESEKKDGSTYEAAKLSGL